MQIKVKIAQRGDSSYQGIREGSGEVTYALDSKSERWAEVMERQGMWAQSLARKCGPPIREYSPCQRNTLPSRLSRVRTEWLKAAHYPGMVTTL